MNAPWLPWCLRFVVWFGTRVLWSCWCDVMWKWRSKKICVFGETVVLYSFSRCNFGFHSNLATLILKILILFSDCPTLTMREHIKFYDAGITFTFFNFGKSSIFIFDQRHEMHIGNVIIFSQGTLQGLSPCSRLFFGSFSSVLVTLVLPQLALRFELHPAQPTLVPGPVVDSRCFDDSHSHVGSNR